MLLRTTSTFLYAITIQIFFVFILSGTNNRREPANKRADNDARLFSRGTHVMCTATFRPITTWIRCMSSSPKIKEKSRIIYPPVYTLALLSCCPCEGLNVSSIWQTCSQDSPFLTFVDFGGTGPMDEGYNWTINRDIWIGYFIVR